MRGSRRNQRGQAGVEYVGAIAVAALIIITIAGTVVGARGSVSAAVESAICRIKSSTEPGTASECSTADDSADPTRPLGDPPPTPTDDPACRPSGAQPTGDQEIPTSITVHTPGQEGPYQSQISGTVSVGDRVLDEQGYEWQPVSFEIESETSAHAEYEGEHGGVDFSVYAGHRAGLTAWVPPHLTDEVRGGQIPSPLDPLSLGEGVTVELASEFYAGTRTEGHLEALRAGFGYENAEQLSVAVVRLPGDRVRVVTGPAHIVRRAADLGIGVDDWSVNLARSTELTDYRLEQAEFDLGTQTGRDAYYAMVLFGNAPNHGDQGVTDTATVEGFSTESNSGVEINTPVLEVAFGEYHEVTDYATETHADGSSTVTYTWQEDDLTRFETRRFDADGDLIDSQFQLRMRDLDDGSIEAYNAKYAGLIDDVTDDDTNLVITFDDEDIDELHQQALEIAAWKVRTDLDLEDWAEVWFGTEEPTAEDVAAWLPEATDDDLAVINASSTSYELEEMLRTIRDEPDPEDRALVTMHALSWFSFSAAEQLLVLGTWGEQVTEARELEFGTFEGPGDAVCIGSA